MIPNTTPKISGPLTGAASVCLPVADAIAITNVVAACLPCGRAVQLPSCSG